MPQKLFLFRSLLLCRSPPLSLFPEYVPADFISLSFCFEVAWSTFEASALCDHGRLHYWLNPFPYCVLMSQPQSIITGCPPIPPMDRFVDTPQQAFEGKMVSPRNEAASLGALLAGLRRKFATLGEGSGRSTAGVAEDEAFVAALEGELEQQQQPRHRAGDDRKEGKGEDRKERGDEDENGEVDATAGADADCAATTKSLRRKIAAARVRLEERAVVAGAVAALDASLRELQSAASAGVAGIASFETLHSSR